METSHEMRIVMLGKTGAGKSSTGNTILQERLFPTALSPSSTTKQCSKHSKEIGGRNVSVIDTAGLFDTNMSDQELKAEITKCIVLTAPGPHAFLVVISLTVKFTEEEMQTVLWIRETFSEEAAAYTMVLFTRGDDLDRNVDEYIRENEKLSQFVKSCKGGYHVFNNKDKTNGTQVTQLLQKINALVGRNGGSYYTNSMYLSVAKAYGFESAMELMKDITKALAKACFNEKGEPSFKAISGDKAMAINAVVLAVAVGYRFLKK